MGKQILLMVSVLSTNATDAKRQANILAKEYATCEIVDVLPSSFSWDQVYAEGRRNELLPFGTLFEWKVIFAIASL